MKDYKNIFSEIYKNGIWNNKRNDIPLSGPGSSLINTKDISILLDNIIEEKSLNSVLDLGCGDLTWITQTNFFGNNSISYIGIDIVDSLIIKHRENYPQKKFISMDITKELDIDIVVDIVIIRDVIFHLKNDDILQIFENLKKCSFKYICITSDNIKNNDDTLNKYHFAKRNITIAPFFKNKEVSYSIYESIFDRNVFIYSSENFN